MNPKIQKTIAEIEKTKAKIAESQARLSELEAQRVDLENTDVISAFRSASFTPEEFAAFLQAYKSRGAAPTSAVAPPAASSFTSGYRTHREEDSTNEKD